jgi:hypothetical protein
MNMMRGPEQNKATVEHVGSSDFSYKLSAH